MVSVVRIQGMDLPKSLPRVSQGCNQGVYQEWGYLGGWTEEGSSCKFTWLLARFSSLLAVGWRFSSIPMQAFSQDSLFHQSQQETQTCRSNCCQCGRCQRECIYLFVHSLIFQFQCTLVEILPCPSIELEEN